ncbi:MAG: hypothetical protein WBP26_02100 [Candidatus Saccharimonadales bacterium]
MSTQENRVASLSLPAEDWRIAENLWLACASEMDGIILQYGIGNEEHRLVSTKYASNFRILNIIRANRAEADSDTHIPDIFGLVWNGEGSPLGMFVLHGMTELTDDVQHDLATGKIIDSHPPGADDILDVHLIVHSLKGRYGLAQFVEEMPEAPSEPAANVSPFSWVSKVWSNVMESIFAYGSRPPRQIQR